MQLAPSGRLQVAWINAEFTKEVPGMNSLTLLHPELFGSSTAEFAATPNAHRL
jgi:hypothetical protein